MARVPFDLGRPAFVTLDQHGVTTCRAWNGGGIIQRHTRYDVLRRTRIREDLDVRPSAPADSCSHERERSTHQLQKAASVNRRPNRCTVLLKYIFEPRKLALIGLSENPKCRGVGQGVGQVVEAAPSGLRSFCDGVAVLRWHP